MIVNFKHIRGLLFYGLTNCYSFFAKKDPRARFGYKFMLLVLNKYMWIIKVCKLIFSSQRVGIK